MRSRAARWIKRLAIVALLIIAACAAPILWNETQCIGKLPAEPNTYRPILAPEYRRNLVDSYLTYPEWSIVHAYEDFAAVARQRGESAYRYTESVVGYWRNLCGLSAIASAKGTITTDMKAMLYLIGLSFTAEMGVKGLYEKTIGLVTTWIRGPRPTPEDQFAFNVADEYAAFLRQTPWYEFPFWQKLTEFWRETPFGSNNIIRATERRIALTLEYGVKAGYAKVFSVLAALSPAARTIRSVVTGPGGQYAFEAPPPTFVEKRADGSAIIETPRYRAFTDVIKMLVGKGAHFIEIAGNDTTLVTVLAKSSAELTVPNGREVFRVPLQSREGWDRRGVSMPVREFSALLQTTVQAGAEFEHAYDY
jgi:hypothetical protein